MNALEIYLLKALIFFLCIDFSGDYIILYSVPMVNDINQLLRFIISIILIVLILNSLRYIKLMIKLEFGYKLVLLFVITPIAYGFFWGFVNNQSLLALREFYPYLTLLLIPFFYSMSGSDSFKIFNFFLKILIFSLLAKLLVSQIVHYIYYGGFSWKILLRISPLLMLPLSYILYSFSTKNSNKLLSFYFVAVISGILFANARALFISTFSVALFSVKRLSFSFIIKISFLTFISVLMAFFFTNNNLFSVFGYWSGEAFDGSYDYRDIQLGMLIDRVLNHTISGVGFGYFTPGYESYEDIENSYLLELDLLNFFTKVGLPFSLIYISGFILYFLLSFSFRVGGDEPKHLMLKSFNCFLIGSLIYSLFQTFHSSILFWIFFGLAFSLNAKNSDIKFPS